MMCLVRALPLRRHVKKCTEFGSEPEGNEFHPPTSEESNFPTILQIKVFCLFMAVKLKYDS
jgi:hypothetical protein